MRAGAALLLLLGAPAARAELPLPSYRDAVVESAWHEVNALIESGQVEAGLQLARRFEAEVTPDARLRYLVGLALRLSGDPGGAERAWKEALALDPSRRDAWNDLGELYLLDGRLDLAREAFAQVSRLLPEGPLAWVGPFREAEVAGLQGRADDFERHLREAIRRGFRFELVVDDPRWASLAQKPEIRPVLERMLVAWAPREVREELLGR